MNNEPLTDNGIFVFGSNLGGRHSAGAALYARQHFGAIYGQSSGLQGRSYAIPTKDARLRTLSLQTIEKYVKRFILYAMMCEHKGVRWQFNVTAIGCGLAGYAPEDIAPMFSYALELSNVSLPPEFLNVLNKE